MLEQLAGAVAIGGVWGTDNFQAQHEPHAANFINAVMLFLQALQVSE